MARHLVELEFGTEFESTMSGSVSTAFVSMLDNALAMIEISTSTGDRLCLIGPPAELSGQLRSAADAVESVSKAEAEAVEVEPDATVPPGKSQAPESDVA